jgi:hypothetical protein
MKYTASQLEKIFRLIQGETIPHSQMKTWAADLRADEMIVPVVHGSHVAYRAIDGNRLRNYLRSQGIEDLEGALAIANGATYAERSNLVDAVGDSKWMKTRPFPGFPVNSYQPIAASLDGSPFTILPPTGSFTFICDWQHFDIPEEVLVVGVENSENFRNVARQQYLFGDRLVLFVSRYPQSRDLINWLQRIPNHYLHFGDLDLAGIHNYLSEIYRHIGQRSAFFIPDDAEERVAHGSRERYDVQLPRFGKMLITDPRVQPLVDIIHRQHRGYDQEGYIE